MRAPFIPLVLFLFVCVFVVSGCKKNRPAVPDRKPQPEISVLKFTHQQNQQVEHAVLDMASATDGKFFYVCGGDNYGQGSDLYVYDPESGQWRTVALSLKRTMSKVNYFKGKVFISGGGSNTADQFRIDIYDTATGSLSVKLFGNMRYEHRSSVALIAERYLVFNDLDNWYVYDGESGNWETISIAEANQVFPTDMVAVGDNLYLSDVHYLGVFKVFNLKTRQWSSLPAVRHQGNQRLLAFKDQIYCYGNRSFEYIDHIDVLDVKANTWSKLTFPGDRTVYNLDVDPKSESLILTGGRVGEIEPYGQYLKTSDDMLVYSLLSKEWKQSKLKYLRYAHTTMMVGDHFIVFGGQSVFNGYPVVKLPMEVYGVGYEKVQK